MTRLIYLANVRLPTEKAHGLQIVQNCEAFAQCGIQTELWVANRFNTQAMRPVEDVYQYYGVQANFRLRRLFTLDLLPLVPDRSDWVAKLIFALQMLTFAWVAFFACWLTRADIFYSRDVRLLALLSLIKPRSQLAYEAHQLAQSGISRALQRWVLGRVGTLIATTPPLRADLLALLTVDSPSYAHLAQHSIVAHDGFRATRFADLPNTASARAQVGWDASAYVVGYVGRLHTMKMGKGVDTLLEALLQVEGVTVALVGGPDDMAEDLRAYWIAHGLPAERFLYAGQVPPSRVPLYLRAFDVCVMPLPFTPHFAYHASPLKLFEYMAAERAVIATDLPSWADVVRDGENALLVPPSDVGALAEAVHRLQDASLRDRMAQVAHAEAFAHYTWRARAERILTAIGTASEA